ncbi:MAG: T9SS C-terminal target domain-containing protein [Bacteroidetes bacterium]|nr:MAG: T9SS C-terminal target domain-containing protein [Bacteroidota bacterium]
MKKHIFSLFLVMWALGVQAQITQPVLQFSNGAGQGIGGNLSNFGVIGGSVVGSASGGTMQTTIGGVPDIINTTLDPVTLTGVALSTTSAQLTWGDIAGEANYIVEHASNNPINFLPIATLPANALTYTHTGLAVGSKHYYRIKATAVTASVYSNIVEVNTLGGVRLFADSVSYVQGSTISFPIRVKNFNNIVSAQGSIAFDSNILTYAGVESINFPNAVATDFNLSGGNTVSFVLSNATGITLADSGSVFNLKFTLIGALGSQSDVTFGNVPVPIEVADDTFSPLSVNTKKGIIRIVSNTTYSGRIITPASPARGVQGVTITSSPATQTIVTDTTGTYSLALNAGVPHTITPQKNNDSLMVNGITSLDLALIRRHILGIQSFATPFKMIAADVNKSATITALDIAMITNVILGVSNTFNNRRWAFVRSDQALNTSNAFLYDSTRVVNPTQGTYTNQNFYGVKLGDVNDTWNYTVKDTKIINFEVAREEALPTERVVLPFKVRDFEQVGSMQFTLQWNPQVVTFVEVKNKLLAPTFALNKTQEGLLTLAWYDETGKYTSLPNGSEAFELVFEAKGKAGEESNIDITSKITPIFAYDFEDKEMLVQRKSGNIKIVGEKVGALSLYPNPTVGKQITIDAPHTQAYQLTFTNVLGQDVLKTEGTGSNILDLKRLAKGVYVVKIESNGTTKKQKIVVQ